MGWRLDLDAHMWQRADDKRMVQRLVHLARSLREGSPVMHHPALRAAADARLLHRSTIAATFEPPTEGPLLADGRVRPAALVDSRGALVQALKLIHDHIDNCRQHPELPLLDRAVEEQQIVAVMAVDYEYDMRHQHMGMALAQVAIGRLVYVFDAWKLADELFSAAPVDGQPSLRHWLEAEEVVIVTQACSGDCKLLLEQHSVRPVRAGQKGCHAKVCSCCQVWHE